MGKGFFYDDLQIGLAFSDYLSIRMLGILLPVAVIAALLGDLLLLPALIGAGLIRAGAWRRLGSPRGADRRDPDRGAGDDRPG